MSTHNGFISPALCGADGSFSTPPAITLTFPHAYEGTIPGITIDWSPTYGEWAASYRVTAYYGERIIFSQIEENNQVTSVMAGDISGYTRLVIEILSWCKPYRRARVERLFLGMDKAYGKSEIMDFSATLSADPISAVLPKSEITFSLLNLDGQYNPDNPSGEAKYLMERQPVTVRIGYKLGEDIEWIKGGTYYLSEWDTPQNGIAIHFTARDALEFMTDPYTGPSTGTLMEIAQAAFRQASLPLMEDGSERWHVDNSLSEIPAPPQPERDELGKQSIAVVLQYVANAGRCVFYQDRDGVLHIEPLDAALTDYNIDRFNSYANSELTLSKQLKAVDVNDGQFVLAVGRTGETQPIANPLISDEQAQAVALWAADYLQNRRQLSGSFRADPRLDPLDMVRNENQFAVSYVLVTEAELTYNGAFRGSYKGRSILTAMADYYYAGEIYAGEV